MSGHSKWHNIQKTKGAADAKRSQIFTKIAREMIVAVKTGGSGDPANNSRLATVIAKAKAANMPNDNIKRTIDKALGAGNTDSFESVVYEGYGPNGVAIIVDALTDNRNRTAPEVRHLLDKYGKGLGATGCVSWSFDKKGVIVLDAEDLDEDTVMMDALECGADDMQADDDVFEIYTSPDAFNDVVAGLEGKGYTFLEASVQMVPQNYVKLTSEEDIKNMEKLLEFLEDNDDVRGRRRTGGLLSFSKSPPARSSVVISALRAAAVRRLRSETRLRAQADDGIKFNSVISEDTPQGGFSWPSANSPSVPRK